ncbi:unnamed protein product [Protopolystoma xenopodis]|uniref:Uncharacterized protein n=1 Tax=Protopolystoma xenopodis TaxID=117903 RepID=A0A448XQM9_9PLAT|nr:unnamed protein product [Protopolystoma xenopodis]
MTPSRGRKVHISACTTRQVSSAAGTGGPANIGRERGRGAVGSGQGVTETRRLSTPACPNGLHPPFVGALEDLRRSLGRGINVVPIGAHLARLGGKQGQVSGGTSKHL